MNPALANEPGKAGRDDACGWAPAIDGPLQHGVSGAWLQPGPAMAPAMFGGAIPVMENFFSSCRPHSEMLPFK